MGDNDEDKRSKKKRRYHHIDTELDIKKKALAKLRFRSLVRRVIANLYWLLDETIQDETDDVKERVKRVMKKKKSKGQVLLTVQDKIVMMKPAIERTAEENRTIWKQVGGYKCFRHYPNHVKRHLTVNSIFTYIGPGRVVMKEGHKAEALYFILSGKVEVTKNTFDEVLEKYYSQSLTFLGPGDVFGEISLLHNINRTSTITTVDHCEFLRLEGVDFNNILLTTVQKHWDAVSHAMSLFSYFDTIDENAKRDGCHGAKIVSFKKDDVILGDGKGIQNFAYFILSGSVQIIESLRVITEIDCMGIMRYTLFDPDAPQEEEEIGVEEKILRRFPQLRNDAQPELSTTKLPSRGRISTSTAIVVQKENRMIGSHSESRSRKVSCVDDDPLKKLKLPLITDGKSGWDVKSRSASRNVSRGSMTVRESNLLLAPPDLDPRISYQSVGYGSIADCSKNLQKRSSESDDGNMRTYFMEVCRMLRGSTFGLGENMRDRRVVAVEKTRCLMLPIFFLMMHNTANIWTRIKYYLNKKIPDKKHLFKRFVKMQRWARHRENVISQHYVHSRTTMHDVPLSSRLETMYNIAYDF